MSNTQRWTQPGWDHPGFCESKKHQQRDRKPIGRSPKSRGRKARMGQFRSLPKEEYGPNARWRNSLGNLLNKIDQLRKREALECSASS